MFYIGDRVCAKYDKIESNKHIKAGMTGTVIDIIDIGSVGVAFDEYIEGHCCNVENACPFGYGWYVSNPSRDLELVENEAISSIPEDELLGFLS